jgi:CubicO group peptidase (beta-lactamase class C family)
MNDRTKNSRKLNLCAVLWSCIAVLVVGCQADIVPESAVSPTGIWEKTTPEEQGMDSTYLAEMLAEVKEEGHEVDSIMVVRNGYMVLDAYIDPFRPGTKHIIHSCTKSIVSALIGIAIEEGHIQGVEQPILDIFPGRTAENMDERKKAMTLKDVLTMSTGFDCRDSYLYEWQGIRQLRNSDDWVQFVLDMPMLDEPGKRFEYCNSASFLLSAILSETTGMNALAYAQEHLFRPLGISDVTWPENPQGINIGWGELHMRPHDMAKIGNLYLNEGMWGEDQIVPRDWVEESTRQHITATLQDGYGYQWWIDAEGIYMALGYAGQFIFVIPEKELVVVFTSDLEDSAFYTPENLLKEYIIPAAVSSTALPENPEGVELLESYIDALAALALP